MTDQQEANSRVQGVIEEGEAFRAPPPHGPRVICVGLAALLLGAATGGCGAEVGGGGGVVNFPPRVIMERWESISGGVCKGWLTNDGDRSALNARVYLWYSTPQGDTMLIVAPTTATIRTHAQVAFFAPAQITRGEARFPGFAQTAWEGSGGSAGGPPERVSMGWPRGWCLLSADSARGFISSYAGLAYNIVMDVETVAGTIRVPTLPSPLGEFIPANGVFRAPVRDSAGIKLNPRVLGVHWEDYAGVADSLVPAYERQELSICN